MGVEILPRVSCVQGMSGIGQESGLGITFSELANKPLLAGYHAPLPIIVVRHLILSLS
jgi:hypothetical protein